MQETFDLKPRGNVFLSHKLVTRPRNKTRTVVSGDKLLPNYAKFANTIQSPNTHLWPQTP